MVNTLWGTWDFADSSNYSFQCAKLNGSGLSLFEVRINIDSSPLDTKHLESLVLAFLGA